MTSETRQLQGFQEQNANTALFRPLFFKKTTINYPVFGLFPPLQNAVTPINSHFQFLRWRNFSQKRAIFEGQSIYF